jgi:hypothetical protein
MLQDCRAVKTLLLKMKRVLQEVMACWKINVSGCWLTVRLQTWLDPALSVINCMTLGRGQASSWALAFLICQRNGLEF